MATVLPFKGLRPAQNLASKVASPPYDVLDSEQARDLADGNPNSFLHIIKPEIDLPADVSATDPSVYQKGAENLDKFIKENVLIQDAMPRYYVYTQILGEHSQTGLVACVSVDEYNNKIIKKHEHTRPDKVKDRVTLMNTLNAQTGPIFLAYDRNTKLDAIIAECKKAAPVYDFVDEQGVQHIFYVVENEELTEQIQSGFADVKTMYIADGHHRSEGASELCKLRREQNPGFTGKEDFNYFLSVIFPHDELLILGYNRVVHDLNGLAVDDYWAKVNELFTVEKMDDGYKGPQQHTKFGMYIGDSWYELTINENLIDKTDAVKSLDVALLQDNLLGPVLGIDDPRTNSRIKFVGGFDAKDKMQAMVDSGKGQVAFLLFATQMKQVMDVADADDVMPPKSTWFEPKLRSGLVTHLV